MAQKNNHKNGGDCCSFCGAKRSDVPILFQGMDGANICSNCVERAHEMLVESKAVASERRGKGPQLKMEELLNTHPGSASVMGLLFDTEHRVQLVMDRDVYDAEYFCCHPCDNHGSLKIKTSDLLTKFLPHVGHEPIVVDLPRE